MTRKISVKVCYGTTCFIMGASHFPSLEEDLPEDLRAHTSVEASACLQHCHEMSSRAPYVEVDGAVIENATIHDITSAIRAALDKDRAPDE